MNRTARRKRSFYTSLLAVSGWFTGWIYDKVLRIDQETKTCRK